MQHLCKLTLGYDGTFLSDSGILVHHRIRARVDPAAALLLNGSLIRVVVGGSALNRLLAVPGTSTLRQRVRPRTA